MKPLLFALALPGETLPPRQQFVAAFLGLATLILIIYLVRQRKLREEFAWVWLITGFGIFLLSIWYDVLIVITRLIGAVLPTSALFFCGLLFLVGICLHFSIRLSLLTNQVKNLTQEFSILHSTLKSLQSPPSLKENSEQGSPTSPQKSSRKNP